MIIPRHYMTQRGISEVSLVARAQMARLRRVREDRKQQAERVARNFNADPKDQK
jgi:hypothetical protein